MDELIELYYNNDFYIELLLATVIY